MKTPGYCFRTIEEWKTALTNLPSFFELMRSIFGAIKTPYNKQRLIDDLLVFLSRDDIRKIIAAYIDGTDHKVIAATALLEDPSPAELEDFFLEDEGLSSLRVLLLHLEERFILFRFYDEEQGKRRLALNPVLEPMLAPLARDTGVLFPAEAVDTGRNVEAHPVDVDDRVLAAFFAFVSGEEDFFKAGGIRKKILDQGKKLFPCLDLDTASGAMKALGLFYAEGEKFFPVSRKIQAFAVLGSPERREYWAAGLYAYLEENNGEASNSPDHVKNPGSRLLGFSKNRIQNLALLIHKFCAFLKPGNQYPEITLRRFTRLLERDNLQTVWNTGETIRPGLLIDAMEDSGLFVKSEAGRRVYVPVKGEETEGPVMAMDSDFSFVVYPGIPFGKMLELAAFSQIREEPPFRFTLTRASVVKGFDRGLRSADMIKILKGFSGNRIGEGLEWTLKDWEAQYNDISLHEGLILRLSEERRYLAETESVASLIRKTLAPGLYLLAGEGSEAAAALRKAGVDIIARPDREYTDPGETVDSFGYRGPFPAFRYSVEETLPGPAASETKTLSSQNETKEYFRAHLEKLKLSQPEKDELLARIERRVILTEAQLDKGVAKFQRLEAKGLDYIGKTAIAKQAISEGCSLEITWPGPGGMIVSTGVPSALEKKEGDNVLVLTGEQRGTEVPEILRIPLGKISLMRLIRKSILSDW